MTPTAPSSSPTVPSRLWWTSEHQHSRCWWNWELGRWVCPTPTAPARTDESQVLR
ncbi:hypothetical protein [uncultured Friedmanniella sp.]|uniref:hypothetical protein n=1 Tax=uncultured Friedmanniella sp. TaxID=335381 RepID=UPI0035CBCD4E